MTNGGFNVEDILQLRKEYHALEKIREMRLFKMLLYRVLWELARDIEPLEAVDFSKN